MKNIKVSILVPVYGVEKYIARCAESIFRQTYENIEYVFVNDCTKDNSIFVLKKVLQKYPKRESCVRIINHETNRGLAAARNTAVAAATGEFVMHVDSDDYVDSRIVEKAVEKQIEKDADIVVIDFKRAYPQYTTIVRYSSFEDVKDYCLAVLARHNSNSIWAKLIRRILYTNYDINCKEGYNQGEDFQVVPRLLYNAKVIVNLREPLYFYDCSNIGSYTNNFSKNKHDQNWESMNVVRNYFIDKGNEYVDAVNKGIVRQLVDDLIVSAKTSGQTVGCYYEYAVKELSYINRKYWKAVPLTKRVILLLANHFYLMKAYTLFSRLLRQTTLKLKFQIQQHFSK
ncbi:glycosyltransferase family 2 protein [Paraprevotella xylaniphila]|uniref:glycosyltransferase family 2 protein n=1 Tax=Paraprevotella xylaniphila TaxID=454155 RepID=UPI0026DB4406|nr:glycosyltransferase family A protein [Paraprevotella xylaniphila]